MSILVTGGAGYIGSHMVLDLVERGERVIVLDDLSTGFESAVAAPAELIVGDLGDRVLLDRILRTRDIETVIHFAGSVVVPESAADPLGYYLNNTVKTRELVAAAVANGVGQFIFSSTAAVYGLTDIMPVREDSPVNPLSPYGYSRAMGERMLADAAESHGMRYVALRYYNVAGADPKGRIGQSTRGATHLIKVAVEAATGQRDHVAVFGTDYDTPDGTGVRDFIHVSDLVSAHGAALDHLRANGTSRVLNCGYGGGHSVLEVLETVQKVSGRVIDVRARARRVGDVPVMVANADAIRRELGWTPNYANLTTIVEHAFRWEQRLAERIAA